METYKTAIESQPRLSISERKEILAPAHFVSVFHETRTSSLPGIDKDGLKVHSDIKHIGGAEGMMRRNELIDTFRPAAVSAKGLSRNNIYGYPFLEHGNGFLGANQRFIKRDVETIRDDFKRKQERTPDILEKLHVTTFDEYLGKITASEYLKSQYPGEILEMKVDPKQAFVGDLEYITKIEDSRSHGMSEDEAVEYQAKEYWKHLVSLEEFLKWYKKPEWAEDGQSIKDPETYKDGAPFGTMGFYLIKGAPDHLPRQIDQPEILIPQDIPQEYIKLVQ
ncbi:hypothetical protein KBD34_04250 [Patescibacteria group bacterium]|nr:hypothetical protein [Patescibacteria group bacterium]